MNGLETTTFGDLIENGILDITDGYRAKNSELGGEGLIFLRAGHVTDTYIDFSKAERFREDLTSRVAEKVSRAGDVAVTTKGNSTGRVAFISDDMPTFVYSPHLSRWRSLNRQRLCPGFLHYWSRSREFIEQLQGMMVSTDMAPYLSLRDQRSLRISLPPIACQRDIAGVLGALDDKIEQNRRTARALERLARAIFRAWFVDFEPVKAKAEGATYFPSMPQEVFDALPTRFVDSDVGPVPEGWEVSALGEVVHLTMGQSPKSEFYNQNGEGLPFHQGVSDHGFRFPTRRVYCTIEGRIAEQGDILLSVRAPVGRINVADVKMVLGRGLAGIRHCSDRQSFLLYQMQHLFAEDDTMGEGTIYKSVNKKYLQEIPILGAPGIIEEAFERVAKPIDQMVTSAINESLKLAEMRDFLLPKLLSGSVQVCEALNVPEDVAL